MHPARGMQEEKLTVDAYAVQFLMKGIHTILTGRLPHPQLTHDVAVDKWFNFPIGEVEDVKHILQEWMRTPHVPMTLKILYRVCDPANEVRVLEVWRLEYDAVPTSPLQASMSYHDDACVIYKHLIVMTRALYAFLRLLPAHRLYTTAKGETERRFDLQFNLEVESDVSAESCSSPWKEVVSLGTSGGRISIQVATNDIDDLLHGLDSGRKVVHSGCDLGQDWVTFAPKAWNNTQQGFQNPVTEHFKTSLESMKTAMTSLLSHRSMKKALSLPRSHRTPQTTDPSSEEACIYQFLQQLKGTKWPEAQENDLCFSVSGGRALLSMYQQGNRNATNE